MSITPPPPPTPGPAGPALPGAWGNDETTVDTSQYDETRPDTPEPPDEERYLSARERRLMLDQGLITIDELTDEELLKGRVADSKGQYLGRAPEKIPKKMHDEMIRRLLTRGQEKLRADYFSAIETIAEIMTDGTNDASVRLKAADMLMVRVAGKPVEKVELSVEVKPWQTLLEGIAKEVPADGLPEIVAEVDDDE